MDDMGRPNPPIRPLEERLKQKLSSEGCIPNGYTDQTLLHAVPDRNLDEIKANLTNFGETAVIVDKW